MPIRRALLPAALTAAVLAGMGAALPAPAVARPAAVCKPRPHCTPSPTPTSTPSPTPTPTPDPTPTDTPTSTPSPTPTPTDTPTAAPTTTTAPPTTYPVPAGIPADCTTDAAPQLLTWIAGVPDGSTLTFGAGCYRVETVLELRGRAGLTLDGGTFRSYDPPEDQRPIWRVIDSAGMTLRNMTLTGSYGAGGTFAAGVQHAHGVDLRGTSADLTGLTMSDLGGDCVYFGLGYTTPARSSGGLADSTCWRTGRNGVSVTAGDDITISRNLFAAVGYTGVDVEPNVGAGWGSDRVTVDGNMFGCELVAGISRCHRPGVYVWSVVENAPVGWQRFTNNQVAGSGLRIGVLSLGAMFRPHDLTIAGNMSDTAQTAPAVELDNVDRAAVTQNTVPLAGGTMAAVDGSCAVDVSGNSFPGGTAEVAVTGPVC